MTRIRPIVVAGLLALLVLASGCGDDEAEPTAGDATDSSTTSTPSDPSSTPSASPEPTPEPTPQPTRPPVERPACDVVWSGATLPRDYRGCLEGERVVAPEQFTCSMGSRLVVYRDHYALAGRRINTTQGPLAADPDYRSAIQACSA